MENALLFPTSRGRITSASILTYMRGLPNTRCCAEITPVQ